MTYEEDAPETLAQTLGNPAMLPLGIEVKAKVGHNPGDKGLKGRIPSVLLGVERAMAVDYRA